MSDSVIEVSERSVNLTASAIVKNGLGKLMGIFVSAASATPTLKVWDNAAASGKVIVGTFTPIAGTFYPIPVMFTNGLFVTISGTVDCAVFYE